MKTLLFIFLYMVFSGFSGAAWSEEPMAHVKGGCFQMGDQFGDGEEDERPVHEVCVNDFFMDKREVAQKEFQAIRGFNPSRFQDCPDCPVENVTWGEAASYCVALGKRLPTEAEWEYAAREGGKKARFGAGGDALGPAGANFDARKYFTESYSSAGEFRKKTLPVAGFPANSLGLHDMNGNVWEWVADWYDRNYWRSSYYEKSPKNNPDGPFIGRSRVLRGGSWNTAPAELRASNRYFAAPGDQRDAIGFRCVKNAAASPQPKGK